MLVILSKSLFLPFYQRILMEFLHSSTAVLTNLSHFFDKMSNKRLFEQSIWLAFVTDIIVKIEFWLLNGKVIKVRFFLDKQLYLERICKIKCNAAQPMVFCYQNCSDPL